MTKEFIADHWIAIRARFDDDELDTVFRIRIRMPARSGRLKYPS